MNKVPYNLFMLISDSHVSITSVKAVWQKWFGLNPDSERERESFSSSCSTQKEI